MQQHAWKGATEINIFTLILTSVLITVNAEFSLLPLNNEAVIGESIYFDCTTTELNNDVNWHHYRVGATDYEDICLYCLGTPHPLYDKRILVEKFFNEGTGTFRLTINWVLWEDAGRYECQDNGGIGDILTAQLVVLVSAPICDSNIDPNGVLGPNSCNIEPDKLLMSCSVLYHGNVPPIIQWRKVGSVNPTNNSINVSCTDTGYRVTSNLAMNGNLDLHGSSYVCEITSTKKRRTCSSSVINIIHLTVKNSSAEMVYDGTMSFNCSANISQYNNYRWKWFDGVREEVVANGTVLTPSKPGWHKCEVECFIRDNKCTIVSDLVNVLENRDEAEKMATVTIILWVVIFSLISLIAAISFIACRVIKKISRNRTQLRLQKYAIYELPEYNTEDIPEKISTASNSSYRSSADNYFYSQRRRRLIKEKVVMRPKSAYNR